LTGNDFCQLAFDLGYSFFTGVPDSTLAAVFRILENDPRNLYVVSVREDNAVGLAVGAYLGGKRSLVLMQNSGLGYCLTALTSLACLYRIPLVLVIGWRGADATDAPEHRLMGLALPKLLRAIEIPFWVPNQDEVGSALRAASVRSASEEICCALLIRDGVIQ
jgi:sulfopyruvate decarboxylase subunit alpha